MFLILAAGYALSTIVSGAITSRPPYMGPTLSAEVLDQQKSIYYSSCVQYCQQGERCLFIDSKTLIGTHCIPVTNQTKCNTRAVAQHAIEEVCKANEECLQEAGQGGEGYCVDIGIYGLEKNQVDEADTTATDNGKEGKIQVNKVESSNSEDAAETDARPQRKRTRRTKETRPKKPSTYTLPCLSSSRRSESTTSP
jgi:hypothetical protein